MHSMITLNSFSVSTPGPLTFPLTVLHTLPTPDYTLGGQATNAWTTAIITGPRSGYSQNLSMAQTGVNNALCFKFNHTMLGSLFYKITSTSLGVGTFAAELGDGWQFLDPNGGTLACGPGQFVNLGFVGNGPETNFITVTNISDGTVFFPPMTVIIT